ncbi:proline-, glutamic acid- and leucine-rich protein 1-like [Colias croceus]|nr:proline-, glutamic acid- and leucine-rich protein 1-like [Colias croceus]XP_045491616.1 proline-, glutamic acid- and leucine-rich protein 1-like [Colias croceus]XP_045491617.1 proline-, glutamic acid- and leucine-rich protein 1-like [Colias croceus]XP_045491619.1 proline-, glutamic acid- and leucine-rich protein 1-like [Colias croceus]XP_045491620.1 proline-, glutamic acid- and leucine-rich protein 1-like [Colias croceus]XP_045492523.1 proline-, glutamic acid- and leucine-rich protein 1-lik
MERLRASQEQFSALIEFMERYGDLSRPQRGPQGRLKADQMWARLTLLLNSVGGGVHKSQEKWKKVWADWKTKTKKKKMLISNHTNGTGGGPSSRLSLTVLEDRVCAILGETAVLGQAGIQEHGFNAPPVPREEPIPEDVEIEIPVGLENFNYNTSVPTLPASPLLLDPQPSPPPPPVRPPPPLPRSPPRPTGRRSSASPRSATASPRHGMQRARRNRGLTPFDRAATEFVAVEQRRLALEETREKLSHEREREREKLLHEREREREELFHQREMERLRLESLKVEANREQTRVMQQIAVIGQRLLEILPQGPAS